MFLNLFCLFLFILDPIALTARELTLICIPSIFYGSSIKKGSVNLKFYLSGTLIAQVQDSYKNGELMQVTGSIYAQSQAPDGTGSVAGVVFCLLFITTSFCSL